MYSAVLVDARLMLSRSGGKGEGESYLLGSIKGYYIKGTILCTYII